MITVWTRRLQPPAIRWTLARAASQRASPQGPRNSLRRHDFPKPIASSRRLSPRDQGSQGLSETPQEAPNPEALSSTLRDTNPAENSLLSPVHIPEDPDGVLKETHPASRLLSNSGLVVQRQMEMMNVLLGFEQANRYVIYDATGNHVGYMAEQEKGMGNMMARQWFRTHRSFVTHVFDKHENEVLRFHRPFSWINSRIRVYDPLEVASSAYSSSRGLQTTSASSLVTTNGASARVSSLDFSEMRVIGEAQQQWAPLRRKYNLFLFHPSPTNETAMGTSHISPDNSDFSPAQQRQLSMTTGHESVGGEYGQFAYVDEPFLSWDFSLRSADARLIGSVNRNFAGFAREIFTDTGVYALRMDSAGLTEEQRQHPQQLAGHTSQAMPVANHEERVVGMTLDQRAVMLATAVSIDFDYFSRHSGAGGMGFLPLWIPGVGGETAAGGAAAGGAAAGEAGAIGAGAAGEATGGLAGAAGRGVAAGGIGEGVAAGAAGAGTMAGYEAMQRGAGSNDPYGYPGASSDPYQQPPQQQPGQNEEVWGETEDWWGGSRGGEGGQGGQGGQGGAPGGGDSGGGSDDGFDVGDWF